MPKPNKGGQPYRPLPKGTSLRDLDLIHAVAMRPNLAELLGVLCDEWAHVEVGLALLFDNFVRGKNNMDLMEAFECVITLSNKTDILKGLARRRITDVGTRQQVIDHLSVIRHLGKKRAKYIHARWAQHDDFPDDLVKVPIHSNLIQEAYFVGSSELERFVEDINKANDRLIELCQIVGKIVKPRRQIRGKS